jgi:hypothetical protein
MFKTILRVGSSIGFGVVGLLMTQKAIDKYEEVSEKRKAKKTIELESETVEEKEITEEEVQEALATELRIVK